MKRGYCILAAVVVLIFAASLFAQPGNFGTSLHKTRYGKVYWYSADTSLTGAPQPGAEAITNVPIDSLGCTGCHPGDNLDANGNPYPVPYPGADCVDCHATNTTGWPVDQAQCYDCHGRAKTLRYSLGYEDVHQTASTPLNCWDCHSTTDMHGDGTQYNSMLEPGANNADCAQSGCHETLPSGHSSHDPHNGKLHCTACHMKTNLACYSCHFESMVEHHVKRAKQPVHDFVILVNRLKDGKVHPATFQSLTYQGKAWVAMAPQATHSITDNGRVCSDCHANFGGQVDAIQQYNSTGQIKFATWNSSDSTLSWTHGIIPLPENYRQAFKMDFITFNGDPSSPAGPSKNWSFVKDTWDGFQLYFATPLNKEQMAKLGFDTTLVGIEEPQAGEMPTGFELAQNYPNPFNPTTTIRFTLPISANVSLKVFNVLGEEVATLLNGKQTAGVHEVQFDASNLTSGVYFYRLEGEGFSQTKKMFLLK
ncbi:MAG: hypothetical protein Kow0037_01610 [Calditrichia bacterium]